MQDLKINIKGVNILKPNFTREKEIPHKHYHLEITATNNQEVQLKDKLLARGLAIDIKPFNLAEHQETDSTDVEDIHRVLEGNRLIIAFLFKACMAYLNGIINHKMIARMTLVPPQESFSFLSETKWEHLQMPYKFSV